MVDWSVDILHCNDWQTALVSIYLLEDRHRIPQLAGTKSVFTIHNIEYQGRYNKFVLEDVCGLNPSYFNEHMLAFHDDVNLMQGAIFAADAVTTVSPTYARQLQDPCYAHGLEGVIQTNSWKLEGILQRDRHRSEFPQGKPLHCKALLLRPDDRQGGVQGRPPADGRPHPGPRGAYHRLHLPAGLPQGLRPDLPGLE